MSFIKTFNEYIAAAFSGIWVQSYEHNATIQEIRRCCSRYPNWYPAIWDATYGFQVPKIETDGKMTGEYLADRNVGALDVFNAFEHWHTSLLDKHSVKSESGEKHEPTAILVLRNFHRTIDSLPMIQRISHFIADGKANRRAVVVLSHALKIPPELEKDFVVIDYDLPSRNHLKQLAEGCSTEEQRLTGEPLEKLIDAASGLTRYEAEGAFSLSLARTNELRPDDIWEIKSQMLKKSGSLQLFRGTETFADLGGLMPLKDFLLRSLHGSREKRKVVAKGVLLLGPPGCLHPDTPIFDPIDRTTVSVYERFLVGQPFHVIARSDDGPVVAEAWAPREFTEAEMWQVSLENGQSFVVTPEHCVFDGTQYVTVRKLAERLLSGASCRLPTSSESCQPESGEDARRCLQTTPDYPEHCSAYCHPCDAQPRLDRDIDLVAVPSPAYEQPRSPSWCGAGAPAFADTDSPSGELRLQTRLGYPDQTRTNRTGEQVRRPRVQQLVHASRWSPAYSLPVSLVTRICTALRPLVSFVLSSLVGPAVSIARTGVLAVLRILGWSGTSQLSGASSALRSSAEKRLQACSVASDGSALSASYDCGPQNHNTGSDVVKIEPVGTSRYYDFHVPVFNNYLACSVWHHNTGKSFVAKALGNEVGRPTVVMDLGGMKGQYVGQTEAQTRQALKIMDAMEPAVSFVDEAEKALAGASGPSGDSGVSAGQMGTLLTWLNDHTSDIYTIVTVNDVTRLPPEFSRAGRFDACFFVDLPDATERQKIWEIYLSKFDLPAQELPDDSDWTGAEISSCCRLAVMLGLPLVEAAVNVVPVARTASEKIEALRKWAEGRCLSASFPGVYRRAEAEERRYQTDGRKVVKIR